MPRPQRLKAITTPGTMAAMGSTAQTLGGTGASFPPLGETQVEMPQAVRTFYEGTTKALDFSADGAGFAYYPNGRQAVVCSLQGATIYTMFYHKNRKGTLLLNYDPVGIGSCCYENGRPRLVTTETGGQSYDEKGNLVKNWTWQKGLAVPITFQLNDCMSFTVTNRASIVADFKCQGHSMEFQLGLRVRRTDTYMSKVIRLDANGRYILDADKCRESLARSAQIKKASQMGGLSTDPIPQATTQFAKHIVHPERRAVVDSVGSIMDSINRGDFHVDVGTPCKTGEDRVRHPIPPVYDLDKRDSYKKSQEIRKVQMGGKYLPFKKISNSYASTKRPLHLIRTAEYDSFLSSAPPSQLVAVVVVGSWSHDCAAALHVWEQAHGDVWAAYAAEHKHSKPTVESLPFRFCRFEMDESRMLYNRYNLRTVPMYLIYQGGRLLWARSDMMVDPSLEHKRFSSGASDAVALLNHCLDRAQRNQFYPADFKFSAADDTTSEAITRRLEMVFGAGP